MNKEREHMNEFINKLWEDQNREVKNRNDNESKKREYDLESIDSSNNVSKKRGKNRIKKKKEDVLKELAENIEW